LTPLLSGSDGTQFTFSVIYQDSINSAPPSVRQVWIDLDGDEEMDTAVVPVSPFWKNLPPFTFLIPAMAAILFLFWVFCPKKKVAKTRILVPMLVVFAAVVLVGCPAAPPGYTTNEVYDMTWVNGDAEEHWDAGEDFAADVTINAPAGEYTFEFKFETSTGGPVTEGTAAGELFLTIE
jgi:hypothetical protein